MSAKPKRRKKATPEEVSILSIKGITKLFFGSKRRGGVTITMLAAAIITVHKAVPILWDWTQAGRTLTEKILTLDAQTDIKKIKKNVAQYTADVQQTKHELGTEMLYMRREMLIQREMGHRSWALLRDFANLGPPPDPESLVPTPVPTPTRLAERVPE